MTDGSRRRRIPLRPIPATAWAKQQPTWREARSASIEAAVKRATARASGNWYVLAASTEIGSRRPVGREVAGVELVAWRTLDGELHVAPGACPHLGAPLCLASVNEGSLICRWHGLALHPGGLPGWSPYPAHDDGVLAWVRLDEVGNEPATSRPVVPDRPVAGRIEAVATMVGCCEPEDVMANRLDPWHGAWFHPYSFADLRVTEQPDSDEPTDDRLTVDVTFRVIGRLGVPVTATFACPEPRTVVMRIVDGEGAGSVVETHAVPLGVDARGRPRTAVIEATIAHSDRRGFTAARRMGSAVRPLMRYAARRLWRDDLAYAERRFQLRSNGRWPAS